MLEKIILTNSLFQLVVRSSKRKKPSKTTNDPFTRGDPMYIALLPFSTRLLHHPMSSTTSLFIEAMN
jgi:hypothetical protein